MEQLAIKRDVEKLTDLDIEMCVMGAIDAGVIRNILSQPFVIWKSGFINPEVFAEIYGCWVAGFSSLDELTEEWVDDYNRNFDWGYEVAASLNEILDDQHVE